MIVPRHIAIVEIGNAHIQKNIQNDRQTKKRRINPVIVRSHSVLHSSVYTKNPKWFNQKIKKNQKN